MGSHTIPYTDAEAIAAAKTDATLLNYIEGARVFHSADQTISHNTATALAFDTERWDTDAIHDTVTNNNRLTCKTAGKYVITGHIRFKSNATGVRAVMIRADGAAILAISRENAVAGDVTDLSVATVWNPVVDNYVELIVLQTSGGDLDIDNPTWYSPQFTMQRVGQ